MPASVAEVMATYVLDALHYECLSQRRSVLAKYSTLSEAVSQWEPRPCPPKRDRPLTNQQAAWISEPYRGPGQLVVHQEFCYGDDPLLRPNRPWFR